MDISEKEKELKKEIRKLKLQILSSTCKILIKVLGIMCVVWLVWTKPDISNWQLLVFIIIAITLQD